MANELSSGGLRPSLLHKLFGKTHVSTSPRTSGINGTRGACANGRFGTFGLQNIPWASEATCSVAGHRSYPCTCRARCSESSLLPTELCTQVVSPRGQSGLNTDISSIRAHSSSHSHQPSTFIKSSDEFLLITHLHELVPFRKAPDCVISLFLSPLCHRFYCKYKIVIQGSQLQLGDLIKVSVLVSLHSV